MHSVAAGCCPHSWIIFAIHIFYLFFIYIYLINNRRLQILQNIMHDPMLANCYPTDPTATQQLPICYLTATAIKVFMKILIKWWTENVLHCYLQPWHWELLEQRRSPSCLMFILIYKTLSVFLETILYISLE